VLLDHSSKVYLDPSQSKKVDQKQNFAKAAAKNQPQNYCECTDDLLRK